MKIRLRILTFVVLGVSIAFLTGSAHAGSVKLRYGFKPGVSYKVLEKDHSVSKSITEMDIMGKKQRFETPMDRVGQSQWTVKAVSKEGGGIKLSTTYGQRTGGQRWSGDKIDTGEMDMFKNSSAEVIVHPVDGPVRYTLTPAGDQIIDILYRGRFAWMPELPQGTVKEGSEFEHEYTLNSGMYNVKTTDEYYVAEVKGNYVTFDVEIRSVSVIKMDKAPGMDQVPAGMPVMKMDDMKIAYKGEGTAVFDLKEGIFIEREGKMSFSDMGSPKGSSAMPGGMTFSSRTEGVTKYSFEMERE